MAPKLLIFLVVFLISLSSQAKAKGSNTNTGFVLVNRPTETIHLDGLRFDSKSYLQRFGYLEYAQRNAETGASEEQILELAIKTYQQRFGINSTGKLDAETLSKMKMARCGNPDIDNGAFTPRSRNRGADVN